LCLQMGLSNNEIPGQNKRMEKPLREEAPLSLLREAGPAGAAKHMRVVRALFAREKGHPAFLSDRWNIKQTQAIFKIITVAMG